MDRALLLHYPFTMRRIGLIALAGLAVSIAGCVTPSIPIPPPSPEYMTFAVTTNPDGQITSASLTYPPTDNYEGGVVYVFNRTLGVGIIQTVNADGSIGPTTPVAASEGHALVISIENGDQTVSSCVLLKEGTPTSVCP